MIKFRQKEFIRNESTADHWKKIGRVAKVRPGRVLNKALIEPALSAPVSNFVVPVVKNAALATAVTSVVHDPIAAAGTIGTLSQIPGTAVVSQKLLEEPIRKRFPKYKKITDVAPNLYRNSKIGKSVDRFRWGDVKKLWKRSE